MNAKPFCLIFHFFPPQVLIFIQLQFEELMFNCNNSKEKKNVISAMTFGNTLPNFWNHNFFMGKLNNLFNNQGEELAYIINIGFFVTVIISVLEAQTNKLLIKCIFLSEMYTLQFIIWIDWRKKTVWHVKPSLHLHLLLI